MEVDRRIPWLERTFRFDFPVALHHELLERLRGTPARIAERLGDVPAALRTRREGQRWSMQENAGHLADTEALFDGRLDDFDAGAEQLRAADLTNRATEDAHHNDRPFLAVANDLRTRRAALVARLEALSPERFGQSLPHPRLRQPMRIVDMMLFHAEHDDWHLARITELLRRLG